VTDPPLEVHLAPLVIEHPWETLKDLLARSWSRIYDGYIGSGESPPDRVTDKDVNVVNRSMGTRSSRARWEPIIEAGDLPELMKIDPNWDLILMDDHDWVRLRVLECVEEAVKALVRPYIAVAAASKVLHIKRPALVPVCDADVLVRLGIGDTNPALAVAAVSMNLRTEGQRLREPLLALQARVNEEMQLQVTLVRLLELLIWNSHPNRTGWRVSK
jgi:hypothetical protein